LLFCSEEQKNNRNSLVYTFISKNKSLFFFVPWNRFGTEIRSKKKLVSYSWEHFRETLFFFFFLFLFLFFFPPASSPNVAQLVAGHGGGRRPAKEKKKKGKRKKKKEKKKKIIKIFKN